MSNRIATIVSNNGTITIILDGNNYIIDMSHPNYSNIKKALREEDIEHLSTLLNISKAVEEYTSGKVQVIHGNIYYNNILIHNVLTQRILQLMEDEFPFDPMIKFLENLMQNSSARAISELYDFLDHKGLPITEDGCFLAYKGIRADWKDKYSGTIDNSVGNVISLDRNQVDDDRTRECSFGLHVGCLEYVKTYCTEKVIIVKVNPKNVVSVPRDYDAQKIRVCEYEVISEYTGKIDKELPNSMYAADGNEYELKDYDDYYYDDDYDDYYDDDDYDDYYDDL